VQCGANCVGNFSPAKGARNQVGIGLSYRPPSLCSLATQFQTLFLESISRPIAGLKFSTLFLEKRNAVHGVLFLVKRITVHGALFLVKRNAVLGVLFLVERNAVLKTVAGLFSRWKIVPRL
jgi:hypothetical protein